MAKKDRRMTLGDLAQALGCYLGGGLGAKARVEVHFFHEGPTRDTFEKFPVTGVRCHPGRQELHLVAERQAAPGRPREEVALEAENLRQLAEVPACGEEALRAVEGALAALEWASGDDSVTPPSARVAGGLPHGACS